MRIDCMIEQTVHASTIEKEHSMMELDSMGHCREYSLSISKLPESVSQTCTDNSASPHQTRKSTVFSGTVTGLFDMTANILDLFLLEVGNIGKLATFILFCQFNLFICWGCYLVGGEFAYLLTNVLNFFLCKVGEHGYAQNSLRKKLRIRIMPTLVTIH